jgi:hypothetical protein
MRLRLLAATAAALVLHAAPALAGDPIMALSDVQSGMRCTGYSVIHGTDVDAFDVEVLDVVDGDPSEDGPRILVRVSGPAVDETGVGPGFSGSPVYCRGADGVARNIGAISETIGEYGGKVVLATPIESILANPPDAPAPGVVTSRRRGRAPAPRGRALAAPITVSGLGPSLGHAVEAAGRRAGRPVLATPAGPIGAFPPQQLRPGSAVGVSYSSGDLRIGAVGTVAYTDGDRVWAFGHPFEGAGRRALLLQDAYVFRVIGNPLGLGDFASTYKLAGLGHDLGTLSNDAQASVAGRVGPLPSTVPFRVFATDLDTGVRRVLGVRIADETDVDTPAGASPLSFVGPLAVTQAGSTILGSAPGRLTGDMCARILLRELRRPLRFCNRYVTAAPGDPDFGESANVIASRAGSDVFEALAAIEEYKGKPPHVSDVTVRISLRRGQRQAFLRWIDLPRRARRGARIRVRATLQVVRGNRLTRTYRVRLPRDLRPGRRTLRFTGTDLDTSDDELLTIIIGDDVDGGGDSGPRSLSGLAEDVRALRRYDGVRMQTAEGRTRAFRDPDLRVSGRASASLRITRR